MRKSNLFLRVCSFALSICIVAAMFFCNSLHLKAAVSTYTYNAAVAVAYAQTNLAADDKPESEKTEIEKAYSGWQCAEFVSACLFAGGLNFLSTGSNSYEDSCSALRSALHQAGFTKALYEHELVLNNGVAYAAANSGKIAAGDPVFWHCDTCGPYYHAGLCGGVNANGQLTYYARNGKVNGKALSTNGYYYCKTGNTYHTLKLISIRIDTAQLPTGQINVDFYKDGNVWVYPSAVANGMYVKNTATNQQYSLTLNADFPYAYRTGGNVPYGDYEIHLDDGNGNTVKYEWVDSEGNPESELTLDAGSKWVYPNYYTVTYNAGGGSGTPPASAVRLKGKTITLPSAGGLSKTNHTFSGWTLGNNTYAAGATYTVNAKTTFTAAWTLSASPVTVDVKRDGVDWAGCGYDVELRNAATGAVVPLTRNAAGNFVTASAIPHGSYNVYAKSDKGTGIYKTSVTLDLTAGNTTATLNYYTVTFWTGVEGNNVQVLPLNYAQGHTIVIPSGDCITNPGHTFCYWYGDRNFYLAGTTWSVESQMIITGRWIDGDYALGDVNMNGQIDSTDARLVNQHFVGSITLTGTALKLADYNQDGNADSTDARLILSAFVAGGTQSVAGDGNELMSVGGESIIWNEIDWSLLELDAIDWDNCTVESILEMVGVHLSGGNNHEVM